jgi:hypothetical protein
MTLGQDQSPAFGLRNRIVKLARRFDLVINRFLGACQRGFLGGPVRGATGEFRHFGDEHLILVAPIDNDLVFSRQKYPMAFA